MTILTKESIVLFLAHVKNYHKKSATFLHSALKNIHLHPQCNVYSRSHSTLAQNKTTSPHEEVVVCFNGDSRCCAVAIACEGSLDRSSVFDSHLSAP